MAQEVRYLGTSNDQVRWGGNDDPRDCLVIGTVYTVRRTETHSWHTKIELEEWPGQVFNDASFEYLTSTITREPQPAQPERSISLCQATPSYRGHVIPNTVIRITEALPHHEHPHETLEEVRDFHRAQAKELAAGLMGSLPQGTLHELLIELLHNYACVYRGPTADAGPLVKTGKDGILS